MMRENRKWRLHLVLLLPALLLTGCASTPANWSPPQAACPAIPALPPEAKQTAAPPWCSPDCSTGLSNEIESWRKDLMTPGEEGSPASGPMAR